jgi:hypothetical protein
MPLRAKALGHRAVWPYEAAAFAQEKTNVLKVRLAAVAALAGVLASAPAVAQQAAPAAPPQAAAPAPPPRAPFAGKLEPIAALTDRFIKAGRVRGVFEMEAQRLVYRAPQGYAVLAQLDDGIRLAAQLAPKGDKTETWTQSVTASGYRSVAIDSSATPRGFADLLVQAAAERCPNALINTDLGAREVDGFVARGLLLGCPTVTGEKFGQVAVALVVKGPFDFYTLQVTLRGNPYAANAMPVTIAQANAILASLGPIVLCPISIETKDCYARQLAGAAPAPSVQPVQQP